MRVLNIGSLNIDYVYSVDHIILPGETEATGSRNTFLGGKGMNQSCALAKAGVEVYHGGMIGEDGRMFLDACKEYGVHDEFIKVVDGPSGHTVIQIDKNAQNSILLYGGANQKLTCEYVDEKQQVFQPIFPVKAVDTTAAGDTFTGYFLAGLADGLPMEEVLRMSAKASSIAVTREGAVPSIPYRKEVMAALDN